MRGQHSLLDINNFRQYIGIPRTILPFGNAAYFAVMLSSFRLVIFCFDIGTHAGSRLRARSSFSERVVGSVG
ncbi:MAG: hypothetical protein JRG73_19160 [Deltaproteobacteria bacterium]|nr:hypothetical protein [Deltaproteobacteria bacterium]MBW2309048.1 hypothetical protein [Deltaproteobacteria bacterium]